MRTTYRVLFIDKDGYCNQKLLEADCEQAVCDYMTYLGYYVEHIEIAE